MLQVKEASVKPNNLTVVLDPLLFGAPYDFRLTELLGATGREMRLVGRPRRKADPVLPNSVLYLAFFSRFFEPMQGRLPGAVLKIFKGLEYLVDSVRLHFYLARERPAIVHYLWLPMAIVDIAVVKRIRGSTALVYTMHNIVAFHGGANAIQRIFDVKWLMEFDCIIVHTDQARLHLIEVGFPISQIVVVEHPPLALAEPSAGDRSRVPAKRKFRVLMWGSLKPYKGVGLLIEACRLLWESGYEFELALVGKPFFDIEKQLDSLRGRRKNGDLITVFDFVEEGELSAHIDAADIVVFPYMEIDASGALMATIERDRPVIATSIGGFSELKAKYGADQVFSIEEPTVPSIIARLKGLMDSQAGLDEVRTEVQSLKAMQSGWLEMVEAVQRAYAIAGKCASLR